MTALRALLSAFLRAFLPAGPLCVVLTLAASLGGAPVAAQEIELRPGLWEMQMKMKTQSGEMEQAIAQMRESLASMSPEERKQMERMMGAMGLGAASDGTHTLRVCLTAEDVREETFPTREGCTQKTRRSGPNTWKVNFQCKGDAHEPPSSGEGTLTTQGSTAYSGSYRLHTMEDGKPEEMQLEQKGRWLAADCGQTPSMR